ncbi:hypothetical protein [Streptomyces sp. NPDC045714]|uniref:hypothetical protein n=1 Tax=Streptomyces sp. NPDC045714 TaxID=3154913 RepID=UPI0033F829B9
MPLNIDAVPIHGHRFQADWSYALHPQRRDTAEYPQAPAQGQHLLSWINERPHGHA